MNAHTKMARSRMQPRRAVILPTRIRNDLDMETHNTLVAPGAMQVITIEQHRNLKEALSATIQALVNVLDLIDDDPDIEDNNDDEPSLSSSPHHGQYDLEVDGDETDHSMADDEWLV